MIQLSVAHAALKSDLKTLTKSDGKLFFPQAGQVMYATTLEALMIASPEQSVNRCGFFIEGTESNERQPFRYDMALQCLLTFPAAKTDDDFIKALEFSDEFLNALDDQTLTGFGTLRRSSGPTPLPGDKVLGIRIDFKIIDTY